MKGGIINKYATLLKPINQKIKIFDTDIYDKIKAG